MDVIEFRPERDQYAFTFGGVAPVRKVQPGTMLRLWTDDAFCGALRDPSDMPSAKLTMPFVNPQTGPFYVEGAEPGDTLALHFVDLSPARDFGASSTIPFFGGLTGTDRTVTLQDPLEERTWIYQADRERRTVLFEARSGDLRLELPMDPMLGTVGVAPAAGTWRRPRCGPAPAATWGSTCRGRCSRSATATTGRARASPAGRRSRARWTSA
jgi:acetamidase/formamidase